MRAGSAARSKERQGKEFLMMVFFTRRTPAKVSPSGTRSPPKESEFTAAETRESL